MNQSPIPITPSALVKLLIERDARGATPMTISVISKANARKYEGKDLLKWQRVNGIANFSYQRAVNRFASQDEMAERFRAQKRPWGRHISPSVVINEKPGIDPQYYLNLMIRKVINDPVYLIREGDKFVAVATEKALPYLRPPDLRPVLTRDFSIDNIYKLKCDHQVYAVQH